MGRPGTVTTAVVLCWWQAAGLAGAGVAAYAWRDETLVSLPVLLLQADGVIPFDVDTEHVVVAGAIVLVVLGVLLAGVGAATLRGSSIGRDALVLMMLAQVALAIWGLVAWDDDLARWAAWTVPWLPALTVALLLLPVSRRWCGRARVADA